MKLRSKSLFLGCALSLIISAPASSNEEVVIADQAAAASGEALQLAQVSGANIFNRNLKKDENRNAYQ